MGNLKKLADLTMNDPREAARAVRGRLVRTLDDSATVNRLRRPSGTRLETFSAIYKNASWGSTESGSGTGSELRATEVIRQELPELLRRRGITSLLDAPCGDWNWMQHVDLAGVRYSGVDIVPAVIAANKARFERDGVSFAAADLTQDELPPAEAVLCRDCLVHVSYADISAIVANFRRTGATWLLLNDYPEVRKNRDQPTGRRWRRLNFQIAPFHFPDPLETFSDGGDVDPSQLSLWRFDDVPHLNL